MAFGEKTALVTGASGGLGAALASHLAKAGYAVALHYRSRPEPAEALADQFAKEGVPARAFGADLGKEAEAKELIEAVLGWAGRLDVLINNAGVYHETPLMELSEAQWHVGLTSTATAAFFTTRAALTSLREAPHGRIVMIGDSSADRPTARDLAMSYHIGKTGVLMLARSFAQQEAPHGVTVNVVSPGYLENSIDLATAEQVPAGRYGNPDDIWNAVQFLLQPASDYLTGSNLVVGGGWNLR